MNLAAARSTLRRLDRGVLQILLERALELLPADRVRALLAGFVPDAALTAAAAPSALLEEVRGFVADGLARTFYDERMLAPRSRGTDAFVAELDRLERRCIAAARQPEAATLESIELLLDLVRRIDDDPDALVLFADEPGAWQLGLDWRQLLPAYFRCLAASRDPEEFAQLVTRAIDDFVRFDRSFFVDAALGVAGPAQAIALRRLIEESNRR